jgi:hypothetical protein
MHRLEFLMLLYGRICIGFGWIVSVVVDTQSVGHGLIKTISQYSH